MALRASGFLDDQDLLHTSHQDKIWLNLGDRTAESLTCFKSVNQILRISELQIVRRFIVPPDSAVFLMIGFVRLRVTSGHGGLMSQSMRQISLLKVVI